jgi:hypothetical protein
LHGHSAFGPSYGKPGSSAKKIDYSKMIIIKRNIFGKLLADPSELPYHFLEGNLWVRKKDYRTTLLLLGV